MTNQKKLEEIMPKKHAKELGDMLENFYNRRMCPICGSVPERQREIILDLFNSLLQEIEEKVEEAYKEGIVTFENNHRVKPLDKDIAEGFAKGSWMGFKAIYLDKALKTIKERWI